MRIPHYSLWLRILPTAVFALLLPQHINAQTFGCAPAMANDIVCENSKPGAPPSTWQIPSQMGLTGDPSIQGFATDISVNHGDRVFFKILTTASSYRLDIYRLGYYGGNGARLIDSVNPSAPLPQTQPSCISEAAAHLYDCGNWSVSASWSVPANATSGIYIAKVIRPDTGGFSHIVFIVRADEKHSDILFQTSDETWQAYNDYGGNSLYGSAGADWHIANRAYKVSYNRPFKTAFLSPATWLFNAEYPMLRWLEANGYDVTYFTHVDGVRSPGLILNHKIYLPNGHDEYWSGPLRANVEAARDAGVNLAFFSGNDVFWKTRWENSIDGSGTPYRTLVCYKETFAAAAIDPMDPPLWTGTWRDPTFSPPADGGRPENSLTGTLFMVNSGADNNGLAIQIPAEDAKMRFWRNTSVAQLPSGQTATLPQGTLGYEWNVSPDNGSRPAGLIQLSTTTRNLTSSYLLNYGTVYGAGTATHHMVLRRTPSGALVFSAGTVQWAWGLDNNHANPFSFPTPTASADMKQATVNLLADMGVQPASIQPGLTQATVSTDSTPPVSAITSPTVGSNLNLGVSTTVTGTAADFGGGVVGAIEVSVDGGATWHPATGRQNWSYTFAPSVAGPTVLLSRAVDDSGNIEVPSGGIATIVAGAFSISGTISPLAAGAGATVAISGPESATTTADSSGNYTINVQATGKYTLAVTQAWYSFSARTATITNTSLAGINFAGTPQPVPPSITTQPVSQMVGIGLSATFTVVAAGPGPLTYQWRKNNISISGATSSTYTTLPVTQSDDGSTYVVSVSNSYGGVTSNKVFLSVANPSITTQPASQMLTLGQTATFIVSAKGAAPLAYQWNRNNVPVSGATSASFTTPPLTQSDGGAKYSVSVSNTYGSVGSNSAVLSIANPLISTQPVNKLLAIGQTATFIVTATGAAPLAYQWSRNNVPIPGATSSSYTTPPATQSDDGTQFAVSVSNSYGVLTSNPAVLAVGNPTITTQPLSQTVAVGQTATFTVAARGPGPLIYGWRKNNISIPGATSATYTTPPATQADDGTQFVVSVSNSYGGVTSNVITLYVGHPPVVAAISLNAATIAGGSSSSGSVILTGPAPAGGATVTLSSDNAPVSGVIGVYNSSDLPQGGSVDWASFGPEYTTIPSDTVTTVAGIAGLNMAISNSGETPMETLVNCDSGGDCAWYGNFAPGARVLWVNGTYYSDTGWWAGAGPLTIQFDSPQRGIGFQAMGDENGPFTATICAYTSSSALLGCIPFAGNGTGTADNSAAFMGIYDDALEISKIVIDAGGQLYPHDFGISRLFVTGTRRPLVPPTVTVPAGATSTNFTISAPTVAAPMTANIAAAFGLTLSGVLTINPPVLSSVTLASSSVSGGTSLTGTVTLTGRAPANGAVVTLSANNPVSTGLQIVNSPTEIPHDGTVIWTDLGPSFTSILSGTAVPIPGITGSTVTVSNASGQALQVLTNCPAMADCGFSGNFPPAEPLLWVGGSYDATDNVWTASGPLTLTFNNPQRGVGFSIMADEAGPFAGTVCAYNSSGALLGCKPFNGSGASLSGGANGMAIFGGIYDDTAEVSTVTIDAGGAFYPHDFAIGPLIVANTRRMVPSSVTVQAGATAANFPVNTDTVKSETAVTVTGRFQTTQTSALTIVP